jgi:putative flippase GtrA
LPRNHMEKTKLTSLSIFFPFYNDEGTVERQVDMAYDHGRKYTDDLEVIAMHGGNSRDGTFAKIKEVKKKYPDLVVVDKSDNWEGYAVIKYGFKAATKDWVFYTDGDAQYHLEEDLGRLVGKQLETNADVVNGYKGRRGDNFLRTFLGNIYAKVSSLVFELPIRDTDCDFRLIRRSLMNKVSLDSSDASILAELIKKLEMAGAKFVEIPVSHYEREYGTSNYSAASLLREKVIGDFRLYLRMRKIRDRSDNTRVLRFGAVGVTSIIIHNFLFNLILIYTAINPGVATILSDQVAIVTSFILNNYYTFNKNKAGLSKNMLVKFGQYYSVVIVSTLIQASIVFAGTAVFGETLSIANLFFVIGLGIGFLWNYGIQSRFIWRRQGNGRAT